MAITRLTDIVEVFESKWVYGDVKFGYEGEVNQDHDTQYPLMLIQPPTSTMPEIYNGREEYEFEINFYNLYTQAAQSVVKLQKRWDNLQDLANEWMDFVLKNYQDVTVEVYLNDESIEIERVKDVANDKLVQIKLVFTMSGFTKCFRPTSNFPSDYSDLVVWLSADSNATFDIPTKRVSLLGDRASTNNVAQATVANQPLWNGFDGSNDKSYISFNGTSDYIDTSATPAVLGLPATTVSGGSFSISLWYNHSTLTNGPPIIQSTTNYAWNDGFAIKQEVALGQDRLRFWVGAQATHVATGNLNASQWYHVVAVFTGGATHTLELYIDNVLVSTASFTTSRNIHNPTPISMAWAPDGYGYFMK